MHELRPRFAAFSARTSSMAALLPLALMLAASGCKSAPSVPEDDATLTQAVQGKLTADTSLGNEPIQASVQQGVATLTGTVTSDAARALAASDAAQIAGIRTVVNNLIVQPATAAAPSSAPSYAPSYAPSSAPAPASAPPSVKREKPARKPKPSAEDAALPTPPPPPPPAKAAPARPAEDAALNAPRPPVAAAPAPVFRSITLASGTTLPVRITQTLDSASTQAGSAFSGVLASDVLSDNLVVLPQGTPVSGRVVAVQEAAHFKGSSLLTIELTSLDRKGDHLPITTDSFSKAGNGRGKNSAEKIGGGAAVGAILGGILGGGKGAAIGAAAGGGAGAGVQGMTRGKQVQIESESLVRFHLSEPLTLRVPAGNQSRTSADSPDLQRHQ